MRKQRILEARDLEKAFDSDRTQRRPRNRRVRRWLLLSLVLAHSGPSALGKYADGNETTGAVNAKGYDRNSVYLDLDGPKIDVFNFNFSTQFPLAVGLSYPENAGLTLRLSLAYNSRIWNWQNRQLHRKLVRVRRQNPVGLGFDLSLGRIVKVPVKIGDGPYAYVESSGATHRLTPLASGSNDYRTHDGSHIRAVLTNNGELWTVSFPSGLVQELGHHVTGTVLNDLAFGDARDGCDPKESATVGQNLPCNEYDFVPNGTSPWTGVDRDFVGWHVTKVYSRAALNGSTSPSYTVTYFGDDSNSSDLPFAYVMKSISDQHGRTITFELDHTRGVVTRVFAPAPPTESGTPRTADYVLDYEAKTITIDGWSQSVQVLSSVSSPNVAPVGEQRYVHALEYDAAGRIAVVRYPSGRAIKLNYQTYSYQPRSAGICWPDETGEGLVPAPVGVASIESFLDGDTTNTSVTNRRTTSFAQTQIVRDWIDKGGTCSGSSQPRGYYRYDQVHTMLDPAGNKTEFVYRTPKEPDEEEWYGLLLSEKYFGGGGPSTTPRLMKQVQYGYADVDPLATDSEAEMVTDHIETTWPDDTDELGNPIPYATTLVEDRSLFDAFGHYQRTEWSGSAIGLEGKIFLKDYASDNRESSGSHCGTADALLSNWLGDVVASEETRKQTAGIESTVSRVDYGYDVARGTRTNAVNRRGEYAGATVDTCTNNPSPIAGDPAEPVTEYAYTAQGDLQSERHYLLTSASTGAPNDITTSYTYRFGARESSKSNALAYFDSFRIIDQVSGLVTTERQHVLSSTDTSGESASFAYDVLGRTTKIQNGTDDPVSIIYENEPVEPSPAARLARVRTTQSTGLAQIEAVDHFVHGRFDHEEKLNPDGSRAYRYTAYDNADRVSFVSEWTRQTAVAGVPGTSTDYAVKSTAGSYLFDEPFGRPARVTDALGGVTSFRYFGLNKEVTAQGVALKASSLDDPAGIRTRYYTDAFGRLRAVAAPEVVSPGAGHGPYEETGAAGTYEYDVLGRLRHANLAAGVTVSPSQADRYNATMALPSGMNAPQTRTFEYDRIGHLTLSSLPETITTYLAWNAFGNATETRDGRGSTLGHKHRTTFDGAGRPTKLERVVWSGSTSDTVWNAGASGWTASGWNSVTNCLSKPSWYIGDANCRYAQSSGGLTNATLTSPVVTIGGGTTLSFNYFREVRDDAQSGGSRDRFRVLVQDAFAGADHSWHEVLNLDSTQVSWAKWVQAPVIDLSQLTWLESNILKIQFEFNSVDQNLVPSLRGIGISQIEVKRPASVTLQETTYDEALSLGCNHPRGKPTTVRDYDEATGAPIFTRELHYCGSNARLSDEVLRFDWDRDGVEQSLVDDYVYDAQGEVFRQRKPHQQGVGTRLYEYTRRHGAVIGVTATDETSQAVQDFLPATTGDGIEYNDAGGVSMVRFGNGLDEHIEANADFLPNRIWVDGGPAGSGAFDTGQYLYDGARNIKQIGPDYYRYDAAMRLTWARVNSTQQGIVDLDQSYDEFGNMTAQSVTRAGSYSQSLPSGMAFSGRAFTSNYQNGNRIVNSGFTYDPNGNLKEEPAHDGLSAQHYVFSPENQLVRVTPGAEAGTPVQTALYEGGDHRWFRALWADRGKALITVRDASGQVVADFEEEDATSGLKLQREYVHANGQLVAINSTCGPRPALALSAPTSAETTVWFDKTDFAPSLGGYTLLVKTDTGQFKSSSMPADTPNHFGVSQSEFFPGVTNWIQIETDASCGHTGYSNAVSYSYIPAGGGVGCLSSMRGSRISFIDSGSDLHLAAHAACPSHTVYRTYYFGDEYESAFSFNESIPVAEPTQSVESLPCGSGQGQYWVTAVDPHTLVEFDSSPAIQITATSCGGGGDGANANASSTPGQPGMNVQYVHWDHLGSTRMMTDESGVSFAVFKYYPFGLEAESIGGDELRQKFTGHERDDRVGLDYMMARSCRMALGRFLEPDEYGGSTRLSQPQSWNRYAYVMNDPINATDPTGYDSEKEHSDNSTSIGSATNGPVELVTDRATGEMSLRVDPTLDVVLNSASVPGDAVVAGVGGGARSAEVQVNLTLTAPNGMTYQINSNLQSAVGQSGGTNLGVARVSTNVLTTSDGRTVAGTNLTVPVTPLLSAGIARNTEGKTGPVLSARVPGGGKSSASVAVLARIASGVRNAVKDAKNAAIRAAHGLRDSLNRALDVQPGRTTPAGVP